MTAASGRTGTTPRRGRSARRPAQDEPGERVYRALSLALLPAAVAFGLLVVPGALAQRDAWPAGWTAAAFLIAVVPAVLQGALAFTAPLRALRTIAAVNTGGALLVQASIPFAVRPPVPDGRAWFVDVASLGLIAACLAVRPAVAALVAVAGAALTVLDRLATDGPHAVLAAAQDGAYVLLFVVTFMGLGLASLAAGRAADVAEADAEAITVTVAADAARERERARINGLVHDRVLATLLTAARRIPGSESLERRDAARALAGLHALLETDAAEQDLDGEAFAWQVQSVTTEQIPEALFNYTIVHSCIVPGQVVDAMLAAAEEAMRNSHRHAGQANRTVHVEVDDGVCVDVLDDGIGFERSAVPAARLGIVESIEGRMRALPGGSAQVVTQPEVGTRVALRWRAP